MKLLVRVQDLPKAEALKGYMERRLAFAVDRHQARIVEVVAFLSDLNGPKGGADKRCHIEAKLRNGSVVSIEERRDGAFAAVTEATRRLAYRLGRQAHRLRKPMKASSSEAAVRASAEVS